MLKTVCAPILVAGSAICLITVTITLCVLSFGSAILLKRTPWNLIMKSSVMSTVGPGVDVTVGVGGGVVAVGDGIGVDGISRENLPDCAVGFDDPAGVCNAWSTCTWIQ